jgi:exodeoxyribonuclease V gamma subunit
VIALEDLVRFVQHPVKSFLRRRLRVYLGEIEDEIDDKLSVELDGLERWGVGQRLLDAILAGTDPRTAYQAEIARGMLPPGKLGAPVIQQLLPLASTIAAQAEALAPADPDPDPIDVLVELDRGQLLSGTVDGVRGETILVATFSRVAAKHRLTAWVRLLAATAAAPERSLRTITVGRGPGKDDICVARIEPLTAPAAREQLQTLVDLYEHGMREPLPVYCASSAAYVAAEASGEDPLAAARRKWESDYNYDGEDSEPEHVLVHGGEAQFEALIADSRFEQLAHQLWDGLLTHEVMS